MSLSTMILRALVKLADDSTGALTVQVEDLEEGDADDELEVLEPVGVHFLPSLDEDMAVFESNGASDNRFVMGSSQRGRRPTDLTDAGTGGLHFRGAWRVFLDAVGKTHIGKRDPDDWVALAGLVLGELQDVKADLDAFKSAFDAHTHQYSPGPSAPTPTAPPLTPFPTPHTPQSVASSLVRAE